MIEQKNVKLLQCPNCQHHNKVNDKYCSQCSQKTQLSLLSVWVMLTEFVANIFNYDSKVLTTIRGLFFLVI